MHVIGSYLFYRLFKWMFRPAWQALSPETRRIAKLIYVDSFMLFLVVLGTIYNVPLMSLIGFGIGTWFTWQSITAPARAARAAVAEAERRAAAEAARQAADIAAREREVRERQAREVAQECQRQEEAARERAAAERLRRLQTLGGWIGLTPAEFEHECARLLRCLGCDHATVTSTSGDGGVDVIATWGEKRYAVQCKKYTGIVDPNDVRALAGVVAAYRYAGGIFMTTGTMTQATLQFAKQAGLIICTGQQLVDLSLRTVPSQKVEPAAPAAAPRDPGGTFEEPLSEVFPDMVDLDDVYGAPDHHHGDAEAHCA
jgi:hypothetical protein